MLQALDSAYPPSASQIAAAKKAGYDAWFGYFKIGNDGVLHGWADADFERVLAGGLQTMAYCSGWAPARQVAARAAALGILSCLDDEGGMRADGSWVQGWLDTAGAGLYGNGPVHLGRRARFHILAAYPGTDPKASWNTAYAPLPGGPHGWQWRGSHAEFGITVDSTYLSDGFLAFSSAGGALDDMNDAQDQKLTDLDNVYVKRNNPVPAGETQGETMLDRFGRWDVLLKAVAKAIPADLAARIDALKAVEDGVAAALSDARAAIANIKITGGGLTPEQDAHLASIESAVSELEQQLAAGLNITGIAKAV